MRPLLALLLTAGLGAAPPQVRILSADLVTGPGREPRAGETPFHPRLTVEAAVAHLRKGDIPEFGLWMAPAAQPGHRGHPVQLRVEAVAPEGPGRYRILAAPGGGTSGTVILRLRLRGRWRARAEAPIQRHALPVARPAGGQEG
jgi:hypothetical protein